MYRGCCCVRFAEFKNGEGGRRFEGDVTAQAEWVRPAASSHWSTWSVEGEGEGYLGRRDGGRTGEGGEGDLKSSGGLQREEKDGRERRKRLTGLQRGKRRKERGFGWWCAKGKGRAGGKGDSWLAEGKERRKRDIAGLHR